MMKYAIILLRYLKGYAIFKAKGGFVERFLNLCSKNKINIWNVSVENNTLTACISISSFKKLRTVARKSGVKITVERKIGLIYEYRRYNKRIGLAVGMVIFLLFHLLMSQFVWCIDVEGNKNISDYEIISKAKLQGLTYGTYKRNFDEIKTSRIIAADYKGQVTWMSINIKGSLAIIELREDNSVIGETESGAPCNLVADFDGVILSIETYKGDCVTEIGNGVKKGDMLINGVIINEDLSSTFYAAKGKITALHDKTIEIASNISDSLLHVSLKESYPSVGIFGVEIPKRSLKVNEGEIILTDKRYLNINGYNLPFYFKNTTIVKTSEADSLTDNSAIISSESFMSQVYNQNKNSTVISKNEEISVSDDSYVFRGKYTLIDFIGEEKPILSEE